MRDILKTAPSVKDEMDAQHQGFATYYDRVLCKVICESLLTLWLSVLMEFVFGP